MLPALHCLQDQVDLVAVVTRSAREISLMGGALRLRSTAGVGGLPFADLDAIVVSVDRPSVPGVLATLSGHAGPRLTLVLDTPVLERSQLAATRYFRGFGRVLAGEDCIALPPHVTARGLVEEGRVGRLRHVEMAHSGYRHHALASLRRLTGSSRPRSIRITRWSPVAARLDLRYPNGITASVLEPRRYEAGRLLVAGDQGLIADYDLGGKRVTQVRCVVDARGRYRGMSVDGQPLPPTPLDVAFTAHGGGELEDASLMGQLKIRGYMELVAAIGQPPGPNHCEAYEAIRDNLALQVAERLGYVADAPLGRDRSAVTAVLRLSASVARSTPSRPGAVRHSAG